MDITIKGRIAQLISKELRALDAQCFNYDENDKKWARDLTVDLAKLTRTEMRGLVELLEKGGLQGTKVLVADIKKYIKAADYGVEAVTARTARQAAWMLEQYISRLPNHMVFSADKYEGDSYVGYYVEDVSYTSEQKDHGGRRIPAHVTVKLLWIENDVRKRDDLDIFEQDVHDLTPPQLLDFLDLIPETEALMAKLKRETEAFYDVREKIGKKYTAKGLGVVDLDDATETKSSYISHRSGSNKVNMEMFDVRSQVIVDVLHERDKDRDDDRSAHADLYRWHPWRMRFFAPSEDVLAKHLEGDEDTDFRPELQIPVHPLVPCFDLRRHVRLRVHVNNLAEYKYRRDVSKGLIIPERDRQLIDLLVERSADKFEDIVVGKGQSMNILSGGAPGTGKTLTAEVFAEYKQRPLYSVQCSQLGLKPDDIEKNLGVILQRANRWNAILLLDEADVYIRTRGDNLQQNAIVGVFLRMLEYAQCILFMTTNLPEAVDDAIASRCIVRLGYDVPTDEAQTKIWRTLADINEIKLADSTIAAFVEKHPGITGRDVKNLLKLASFMVTASKKTVTLETLEYALQYKPTSEMKAGRK